MRRKKVVKTPERNIPSGRQLRQPKSRRVVHAREARTAFETVNVARRIAGYRENVGVQTRVVNDENVQIRRFRATCDMLDEIANERKARTRRKRADVDDYVRYARQILAPNGADDIAPTNYRSI